MNKEEEVQVMTCAFNLINQKKDVFKLKKSV